MSTNKTLYISDLDGTLLNRNAELSHYTKDALNRMIADGLCFSVATARTAASAFKILEGVQWNIPLVLLNGVLIYDTRKRHYTQVLPLSSQAVTAIISTLQKSNLTGLMYQLQNDEQTTYYETLDHKPLRDFMKEREVRYHKAFTKAAFADVPPENIIYFTLLDTQDKIQIAHRALSAVPDICLSMYKDIYSPDLWYLEMHSDKATKQNGTAYLREAYGFDHIIGFGDNLNDLPMFGACDVKIAVENANPEVKAAADYICATNDDDGVVRWLEENASCMTIRTMAIDDYERVYALWLSTPNMGLNNIDDSKEGIARYLARNPHTCFVAESGGNIIGAILSGHDGRRGYIHHTAVDESQQRRGIGTALVNAAMAALQSEGINKAALVVFGKNEKGNAFWEKQGFFTRNDLNYRNKAIVELIRIDT